MPPDPIDERRSPMTPQLALRVAVVGSVVLALFAILFFRLWFLQVLTGSQYVAQAQVNKARSVRIAAQRGEILDSSNQVLVSSTKALALQIVPTELPVEMTLANIRTPPKADRKVFKRIEHLLHMKTAPHPCTIAAPDHNHPFLSPVACDVAAQLSRSPYAYVTVKPKVSKYIEYYIAERQNEYRGVQVAQTSIPGYPHGDLAAQVLGYVGQISPKELHGHNYPGSKQGDVVGQTGLEANYDQFLRGTDGVDKIQVNAQGLPTGQTRTIKPVPGHNLQTSLNMALQRVGQQSLAEAVATHGGAGGAFVAMNPESGEVYAMGSNPSYDPSVFSPAISERNYKKLTSKASNYPLLNRAIQSVGPTGSTFKPITATAALQSGEWSVDRMYNDTGTFNVGQEHLHNSGGGPGAGPINLVDALRISDDVFFYNLGARLNPADPLTHPNGGPLQAWARGYGISRDPGIDLPDAATGTLPDERWRARLNRLESDCERAVGPYRYVNHQGQHSNKKLPGYHRSAKKPLSQGGCGIADGSNRPWSVGDNINLAVGQGDVQVSPLQLAVVYSALANGGTVVTPHIGLNVENADGTVLQKVGPEPPKRNLHINPLYLSTIRQGLHEAAQSSGGTSDDVMGSFNQTVYGKTGTAQYIVNGAETDYAWYSCFVPKTATTKPIEVTVWVEKGGFGDQAAAPVARQILSQWFNGKPGPFESGSSSTL
jgi:penicillin-binding protein 2